MSFELQENEYFFGMIRQPDGDGEKVIVKSSASRDAVVKHTVRAADANNWDWVIELRRKAADDSITILAQWTSLEGELPPGARKDVAGLT